MPSSRQTTDWIITLFTHESVAHAVIGFSVVISLGFAIGSEAPSVAYATVYPLTRILRIVAAQLIVRLFF